jgi:hypothetical protein
MLTLLAGLSCISKSMNRITATRRLSTLAEIEAIRRFGRVTCGHAGRDAQGKSGQGLGRVKTKSDFIVMPSGRQIFAFLLLSASPNSSKFQVRLYRAEFSHSQGHDPNGI